jgi:type 1 fimbria pilin
MNKKKRPQLIIAALALMLASAAAYAHNGVEHVMGTVTSVTDSSITVDTVKHTSVTVAIDPTTTYMKNNAQASRKDLKAGDRVVIDAKENADKKLVGVTVKMGSAASEHADHNH